ncbi:MAG: hypothetical protein MR283_06945 [Erysipelotrichaceae bacterium]|nr:hypothetical protein [Erysipelotrichaceae bacterium]
MVSRIKKNKFIKSIIDNKLFVFGVVLMLGICLFHTWTSQKLANFYPINGTYQNFNPVRRFLAGQIPFKDFSDYLGMGHLYLGTITTLLFGGSYQSSLYAFAFLTFLGLAVFTFMIANAVLRKKDTAIFLTNFLLIIFLIEPLFYQNAVVASEDVLTAIQYSLGPGNSARMMRGSILLIAVLLIYVGYNFYSKRFANKQFKFKEYVPYLLVGLVAGISFAWSNDYGIGCWLCLIIMNTFVAFARERKFSFALKVLLLSIVSSLLGLLITVEIFTLGNINGWASFTFGTGGYQSWYFNNNSYRSYYPFDVDFTFTILLQAGLAVVYLKKLYDERGSIEACKRYGILAFFNMACFCVVNEYKLLSNGRLYEVALTVLFLNVLFEVGRILSSVFNTKQLRRNLIIGSVVMSLAWITASAKDMVREYVVGGEGVNVPELGGKMSERRYDIYKARDFLHGDTIFSTYASAQEVMEGTFQPSGIDYIIHALGDNQREKYMDSFHNADFKYATTIRDDFTDWTFWIQRANWFFYRDLYKNWHPVYTNSYETYWARNEGDESNEIHSGFKVTVDEADPTSQKIMVDFDDETVNGLADVYIDYQVERKGNFSSHFLFRTELDVVNTGTVYPVGGIYYDMNRLRSASKEYIPIQIVNGHGEVAITARPEHSTILKVNEVKCDTVLNVSSKYIPIERVEEDENRFVIRKYARYENDTAVANHIIYQGKEYTVTDVDDDDDIYITVEEKITKSDSMENFVQIIK